jgi:N-acetylmuramic acid 6-phosphate etherase
MAIERLTESESRHDNLEQKSVRELLVAINDEDHGVAIAVQKALPQIEQLVEAVLPRMQQGGRLFYIGAGTSGRLGILDASECPPTYGVPHGLVIGLIAGGDSAIRKAVEFAEDNPDQGWTDLQEHAFGDLDSLIGIAASGTTPYVVSCLAHARRNGNLTGCITCNPGSPAAEAAEFPVVVATGPEFVTGSTRMKAGTAQKLVLNMVSTTLMIRLGRVKGNRMVDMQLSNNKLIDRGTRMVMDATGLNLENASTLLKETGSVRKAIEHFQHGAKD